MGANINFPNKRLSQSGIGNPLFVTDIENLTEDLLELMATVYGFLPGGFAIVSGFDYGSSAYTGGIVYMNGTFYKCNDGLAENKWLTPNVQNVLNKIHSDANTYATYTIYEAIESNSVWGGMPQFVGDMNAYRISIKKIWDILIQATTSVLGLVKLATAAEVQAGTDTEKVITPATLETKTATETRQGILEIATDAELRALTNNKIIVPSNFNQTWQTFTPLDGWAYTASGMTITFGTYWVRYLKLGRFIFIDFLLNINITVTSGGSQIMITSLSACYPELMPLLSTEITIILNNKITRCVIADTSLSSDRFAIYLRNSDGSNFTAGSTLPIRFTTLLYGAAMT